MVVRQTWYPHCETAHMSSVTKKSPKGSSGGEALPKILGDDGQINDIRELNVGSKYPYNELASEGGLQMRTPRSQLQCFNYFSNLNVFANFYGSVIVSFAAKIENERKTICLPSPAPAREET